MPVQSTPDQFVGILRDTVVALVRRNGPDLTARQLGVFLTVYLGEGPHTVRGLAASLNVSKPAITRALDRLRELDLTYRKTDPQDRCSVLVQRTAKGSALLREMRTLVGEASGETKEASAATRVTGEVRYATLPFVHNEAAARIRQENTSLIGENAAGEKRAGPIGDMVPAHTVMAV